MKWEKYYENYYSWETEACIRNLKKLTSLGPSAEVAEIIHDLYNEGTAADDLLKRAVDEKLIFSGEDLAEFAAWNNKSLAIAAIQNAAAHLSTEDIDEFVCLVPEKVLLDICEKHKIPLPESLNPYIDFAESEEEAKAEAEELESQRRRGPGLLGMLLGMATGAAIASHFKEDRYPSWESNTEFFKDRPFIDYRDKWGSNNDHNWEADGDMRWDSYE